MYCTHCGQQVPGGVRFCPNCGTSVVGQPAAGAPPPVSYTVASPATRLANYILDYVVFYALCFVVGIFLGLAGLAHILDYPFAFLFGVVLFFLYYLFFE